MANVHILEHPLIQHKLAILRSKDTPVKEFRELVGEIAGLMCYEATRNLPTEEVTVKPPSPPPSAGCFPEKSWPLFPSCGRAWAWWTAWWR